ncbi:hypothetical protein [Streptomyces sp. NPDC058291]|uniref:hypothetical protein n=1 Tax=Streptomyces sp. NPDC058291 TaxID=3346427 RepID=UPI0036E189FF
MRGRQTAFAAATTGGLRVPAHARSRGLGRETLAAGDGRAAHGAGGNGAAVHRSGTLLDGRLVHLVAIGHAYDSGTRRDVTADVGRTPTLQRKIDSAAAADSEVARGAGAGRIP